MTIGYAPLLTWGGMIGIWAGLAPLTAVRVISLLSGLTTFTFTGLIGREVGGIRTALVACTLVAITPFFLVHDVIGIYDPLAEATVTAALFLQIRLARRPTLAGAMLLGIVLGAGVLTKPTTYPAIALLPFGLLVFDWSPAGRLHRLLRWIGGVGVALLITGGLYSIMKLSPYWHLYLRTSKALSAGPAAGMTSHTISAGLARPWHWLALNWPNDSSELAHYVTVSVLVATLLGFIVGLRRNPRMTTFVALWFFVPFGVVLLLTNTQYPRYMLVTVPPLLILAALGVVAAYDWINARTRTLLMRRVSVAVGATVLLLPAGVFDGRVLAAPTTAHYPGIDNVQYVTGGASLQPYKALDRELVGLTGSRPATIVLGEFTSAWFQLTFRNSPNIKFVDENSPSICASLYAVETQVPLRHRTDGLGWRPIQVFARPHHGTPTTLYEAVVPYNGHQAATPDELRAAIGGTDKDYDAYGNAHPCAHAWEQAWYDLHTSG